MNWVWVWFFQLRNYNNETIQVYGIALEVKIDDFYWTVKGYLVPKFRLLSALVIDSAATPVTSFLSPQFIAYLSVQGSSSYASSIYLEVEVDTQVILRVIFIPAFSISGQLFPVDSCFKFCLILSKLQVVSRILLQFSICECRWVSVSEEACSFLLSSFFALCLSLVVRISFSIWLTTYNLIWFRKLE